tara:strand:- start:1012 stop:1566 length:555 start_codon:yes stop_codon:yes gene_type:complete
MKTRIIFWAAFSLLAAGCEVHMGPSDFWSRLLKTQADSGYYADKVRKLVTMLSGKVQEYEINKIAIIDLVDAEGRVPILGEYLASRLVEDIAQRKVFRVAQKGEVYKALETLELEPALFYSRDENKDIGQKLNVQAIVQGKLTDLGTNLDVQLIMVDVMTGEVIASGTETLNRTKFAVEMFRHY